MKILAVVATARKRAIICYKMVLNKEAFNPQALADFHQKYKDKKINQLKKKNASLEAALENVVILEKIEVIIIIT